MRLLENNPSNIHLRVYNYEGTLNPKGGITVLYTLTPVDLIEVSFSVCSIDDLYNKSVGREIAEENYRKFNWYCFSINIDELLENIPILKVFVNNREDILDVIANTFYISDIFKLGDIEDYIATKIIQGKFDPINHTHDYKQLKKQLKKNHSYLSKRVWSYYNV